MRRLLLLLAMPVLLAGCATKVKLADTDPAFASALAAEPVIALGGVVVASTVLGDLSPDDAAAADEVLFSAFLTHRPDISVRPREAVDGLLVPGALTAVRQDFAQLGRLRPDQLTAMGPSLSDCRFLALARITADQVRSITSSDAAGAEMRAGAEGVPENSDGWSRAVQTERRLEITVQLFDLRDGRMVWDAEASSRERQHYAYEDALSDDATYVRDRLADDTDTPTLSREGVYLQTPDLMALLDRALAKVVQKLPVGAP